MLPSARLLKAAREFVGLTQEELAAEAKVAKATVNRIEREATSPHRETVEKVVGALIAHGIRFLDDNDTKVEGILEGLYVINPDSKLPRVSRSKGRR
jgi:transcriptional regulator with XRE-family HTH domain